MDFAVCRGWRLSELEGVPSGILSLVCMLNEVPGFVFADSYKIKLY